MAVRELFVCVKPALAIAGPLELLPGGQALAPSCRQWVVNEADSFALEAALRLRESGAVQQVTCITAGPRTTTAMLAWCVAMGADRRVHIPVGEDAVLDSYAIGALLGAAIRHLGGRLVFTAQRSDDGGSGMVPAALAHVLGAAYLSNAATATLVDERVAIQRRLERGHRQVWAAALPAVVAVEPGATIPRYVSVAALLLAQRHVVEELTPAMFGANVAAVPPPTTLRRLVPPRLRPKKIATPASGQSAADRLQMIMSGGMGENREKKVLKGAPAQLAMAVINLLRERQILGNAGR